MKNIHDLIKEKTIKEIYDAIASYKNHLQYKTGKLNNIFLEFHQYFTNIEGIDNFLVKHHTYDFLLNEYFTRFYSIVESNTYGSGKMDGDNILSLIGFNNDFDK